MQWNLLFGVLGSEISFAGKRKMAGAISLWRSHHFSSLILTLL
jgi:hypothetical protein